MGCSSVQYVREDTKLRQENISLNIDTKYHKKELIHAQSLINLISRIRNKMIYLYHKLIYDTGACLFLNPTIVHCFKAVFYKISCDLKGNLDEYRIESMEDPPYLVIKNSQNLSVETNNLIKELFDFIVELKSYKTIIKQIDKETPGLLYLIFEYKENVSSKNIDNINKGIELFKGMINLRNDIINMYKFQVHDYIKNKGLFIRDINEIGEKAYKENLNDIYKIMFLNKDNIKKGDIENQMYDSINEAKSNMEKIIKKEINDDIINSHESIIIEQKEE